MLQARLNIKCDKFDGVQVGARAYLGCLNKRKNKLNPQNKIP